MFNINTQRVAVAVPAVLAVAGTAVYLTQKGWYGLTLFAVLPVVLGAIAVWCTEPDSAGKAAATGAISAALGCVLFLLLGFEGVICAFMALPLATPLGSLGGYLVYQMRKSRFGARGATMLLLLPAGTVGWDALAVPPVFEVRSTIQIAAPAKVVWKHVVSFSELPEPAEWYFKVGLAYPMRARIEGTGPGSIRYCEFSTGPFVEPIEVWNEPRLLRFRVSQNPAPMHEWSPYAQVLPKHLHGYLVSKHGQFRLTPLSPNRTLLEGTTWYQHGLWPAAYWRWWSDAIIHRIHLRVLRHIQKLAEG